MENLPHEEDRAATEGEEEIDDTDCPSTSYSSSCISNSTDSVPSLLSRLCQAPPANNNRKRKIAQNLPTVRKRYKSPSSSSDPKRVTAQQQKEFPDQRLVVSRGKLFCIHIKSIKHGRGKVKLNSKEKREQDLAKSLNAYDEEVHPVGESLPTDQRVFRIKVVTTFLKAGVPLNKIDTFRDILEESGTYKNVGLKKSLWARMWVLFLMGQAGSAKL